MYQKDFYEQVKDGFFLNLTIDFDALKNTLKEVLPIFGSLTVKIIEKEEGKKIDFIDMDEADIVVSLKDKKDEEFQKEIETKVLTIHVDQNNVIEFIEHNMYSITSVNKNKVLFITSLIGKKIFFK